MIMRRTSATSVRPALICRTLQLRNIPERDHTTANVPVQLRTRIAGLIATQIGG